MSQNEMHFDVAIIGAGFSGTMVAVHLGVNPNTRVTSRKVGRGPFSRPGEG
jgi:glycine/D-amino acid oxidase-like deaminating enzyme